MKRKLCGLGGLVLLTACVINASTIYPIGQAPTAGYFFSGAASGSSARGWDFQVNAPNLSIIQLGVISGQSVPVTLTLWDDATKTELAQIVVPSSKGSWVFGNLDAPVALTKGDIYSVIGWARSTGGAWYVFSNNAPLEFRPTGDIQFLNTQLANGSGPDTFPGGTLGAPYLSGVTDIGYVSLPSSVPEPISFALAGAGILLLFAARSRRSLS